MKKTIQKLLSAILAAAMLFTLAACDNAETETEEETVETTPEPVETEEVIEEEPEPLTESDLLPLIQFCDLYVIQRDEVASEDGTEAEVYDPLGYLLTPVVYDDTVILSVAFGDTAVDVTVPGDYDLTFTVTIDREAYDAALLVPGASSEPVTEEVIITKTVHIVTTEDYAAALADGTIIETAEGTAIVVAEDEADEVAVEEDSDEEDGEDADDNDTSDDDSQDNDTTDSTDDKSDSDNTSTNNDSDTSNVTATSSPTTTTAPATSTGSGSSTSGSSTSSGSTSSGSTSTGSSSSSSSSGTTNTGSTSSGSTSSGSTSSGSTSSGSTSSGSTSSGSTSSGSSSSSSSSGTTNTGSTSSGSTSSGSTSSGSSSSGSSSSGSTSSGTSSSTATATPAPTATTHVHTWVTETVEDGYWETVVDQEAYTEYISYDICNTCGESFLITNGTSGIDYHIATEGHSSYYTHVDKTEHDAVTHQEWVDTSYTRTYCSECGAEQ